MWQAGADRANNRKALDAALTLWEQLTLQFDCWHEPGQEQVRQKVLPPPIYASSRQGGWLTVEIDDAWVRLALATTYFEPIALPLPHRAADQNAALMMLTSMVKAQVEEYGDGAVPAYHVRRQSSFARKAGLSTVRRRARLAATGERVLKWAARRGGDLMLFIGRDGGPLARGKVAFIGKKPRVPRIRTGPERIPKPDPNVSFGSPKSDPNVSTTTSKESTVRKEAATQLGRSPLLAAAAAKKRSGARVGRRGEKRTPPRERRPRLDDLPFEDPALEAAFDEMFRPERERHVIADPYADR